MAERFDREDGVVTKPLEKVERKLQKPKQYKVMIHNDDYTTREFVVEVLRTVFGKPENDAVAIMLHVHQAGVGLAGVYSFEVAETKIQTTMHLARQFEYPLRLTMEPEE